MKKDERDLLDVLIFELEFLEKGGYNRWAREPWRPQFIFEDSPTCMNRNSKDQPAPCSECVLMQLVPPAFRQAKIPCRHIPFNSDGETLDSLYRWGDEQQTGETVQTWLRAIIARLEEERGAFRGDASKRLASSGERLKGIPLYRKLYPKCANPICPTAFHWFGGGKFFRFGPAQVSTGGSAPASDSSKGPQQVKHFWLCERCSCIFTLVYEEQFGVELKLLRPELPITEAEKMLTTHN